MLFRIGIVAIVLSFVPWLGVAIAPLLGLSTEGAAGLIGGAILTAEVLFWGGLVLSGKDTWQTVKAHGWRRAPAALLRLFVRGRPARTA